MGAGLKIKERVRLAISETKKRWAEWATLFFFVSLVVVAVAVPLRFEFLASPSFSTAFNVALSIGTSGIVAFIFYYVVTEGFERKKREVVRSASLRSYRDAKHNIALSIIHASQKGGRKDLSADFETIDKVLTIEGFRELFDEGVEADEGFYAFQNQMHERTPEFDQIIFNLANMGKIFDRLNGTINFNDAKTYSFFVRLDSLVRRIERNGPGYDESKLLSLFIYEIFGGWSNITGNLGYDPIEKAIKNL